MSLLILVVAAIGVFSLGMLFGMVLNAPLDDAWKHRRPYDWTRDGE